MKKFNLSFFILCLSSLLMVNCNKKPSVEPQQDTELNTSVDASFATFIVSDIEMICSFALEDVSKKPQFYKENECAMTGTMLPIRDISTKRVSVNFNNTTCKDGHIRDGSIFIFISEPQYLQHPPTGNENYMRDYNFTGRITLEEYKVDGWLINDVDFSVFLKNLRPDSKTPVAAPMQWSFEGKFNMTKDLESMTWNGKFIKTLVNTNDPAVFAPNAQLPINWPNAVINYVGNCSGTTKGNVPFTYTIFPTNPLTRNFSCYPDQVSSVALVGSAPSPTAQPCILESHPFTSGIVSFTTGSSYQRVIYYGDEATTYRGSGNPDMVLPSQCDNKATLQIKGIFYDINLKQ